MLSSSPVLLTTAPQGGEHLLRHPTMEATAHRLVENGDQSSAQEASLGVVRQGIAMFEKVNVPIPGIIENMSCSMTPGGERVEIFGHGGGRGGGAEERPVPWRSADPRRHPRGRRLRSARGGFVAHSASGPGVPGNRQDPASEPGLTRRDSERAQSETKWKSRLTCSRTGRASRNDRVLQQSMWAALDPGCKFSL